LLLVVGLLLAAAVASSSSLASQEVHVVGGEEREQQQAATTTTTIMETVHDEADPLAMAAAETVVVPNSKGKECEVDEPAPLTDASEPSGSFESTAPAGGDLAAQIASGRVSKKSFFERFTVLWAQR
jgi:hypothetical protein